MKCPKCGYISFDYNQVCPKCNKDIGNEQKKLNLPEFKPEPPYLLEALTGAASASRIGLEAGTYVETPEMEPVLGGGMDDTGVMEKASVFAKDDEGFEMGIEDNTPELETMESGDSIETEISAVDLSEIEFETEEQDQDSLTLDLGDLPDEAEKTVPPPAPGEDIVDSTVAISGLTVTDEGMGEEGLPETSGEEISIDLDEVSDESLEAAMALEKEDVELAIDLEDLADNGRDLDEIRLEPGNELGEGSFDFLEMGGEESEKGDTQEGDSFTESEMLTVELDSEKKDQPIDTHADIPTDDDKGS